MPRKSSREIIVHTIGLTEGNIRTTPDKTRVSVIDAIKQVTGQRNAHMLWKRLKAEYPDVVRGCSYFHFAGRRQRPTPVISEEAFIELLP